MVEAVESMIRRASVDADNGANVPGFDNEWFAGGFDYAREDRYTTRRQSHDDTNTETS